jgi:hypothetical protein
MAPGVGRQTSALGAGTGEVPTQIDSLDLLEAARTTAFVSVAELRSATGGLDAGSPHP